MPIKVDWTDRNLTVNAFRLYRSDSPIPDSPLPTPLAEVSGTTFTYTDNTVVRNKTYYYRVSAVVGGQETLSSNMPLAFMPYLGPGPQKLLRGDWACGFFGKVAIEDMFTSAELLLLTNSGFSAYNDMTGWNKHVYQGKILYYPDRPLCAGISWQQLYLKGLIYGAAPQAEWPAYVKTTFGVVAQGPVLQKGDHAFVVRTPRIRASLLATDIVAPGLYNGEYDNCLALPYQGRALPATAPTLPQGAHDDQAHATTYNTFCADQWAGGLAIVRTNPVDGLTQLGLTSTNTSYGWRPVLELVF
jgi:hypothetical protein